MGTDAGATIFPHGDSGHELAAYVRLGMTPMDALLTATRKAADLLDCGDWLGTLEPGKLADLIVVDGDPLADIALLARPHAVRLVLIAGATVVDRDALLDGVQTGHTRTRSDRRLSLAAGSGLTGFTP